MTLSRWPGRQPSRNGSAQQPNAHKCVLLPLVNSLGIDLFVDELGAAHAHVLAGEHRETHPLESEAFQAWLVRRCLDVGRVLTRREVKEAVFLLKAMASARQRTLYNRSALVDGKIFIDLGDRNWRAVCVTAEGWHLESRPGPLFHRFSHQLPLPEPDRAGALEELPSFLPELPSPNDRLLLLAWVVGALVPGFPRPALIVTGPQGSAKTTLSSLLRQLVDPSRVPLLGRDARADWPLTFFTHATPVFDNFDRLSDLEADLICQGATGRGIARRKLYTDTDQVIFSFMRAMIFNGLRLPTNRPDLLDRALIVELDRISPERRRTQQEVEMAFAAARPRLFGGLLNVLSRALALLPEVSPTNLSRMADFHRFGRAVTRALGQDEGAFDEAYRVAEFRQRQGALDNNFALAVLLFAQEQGEWVGTSRDLLRALRETADSHRLKQSAHQWPQNEMSLGRHIGELNETLGHFGVRIGRPPRSNRRTICISHEPGLALDEADGATDEG